MVTGQANDGEHSYRWDPHCGRAASLPRTYQEFLIAPREKVTVQRGCTHYLGEHSWLVAEMGPWEVGLLRIQCP